jgi:dTDP-glucose 4,6-dehydratase
MKVLATGGAGFIGSNFIRHLMKEGGAEISVVNVDKLTYAGNLESLQDLSEDRRYTFIRADIADAEAMDEVFSKYRPEVVVHLAAESHVDRSIEDAAPFIRTNIQGTQVLLERALTYGLKWFIHVSTDEVYGSLEEGDPSFTETHPLDPSSPYSASKASSDLLVQAFKRTHGLNVVITRCSNNYGPYQFPEKLIPLMIRNAMTDQPLPVYGDGRNIRDWLFVEDHCRALLRIIEKGRSGEVYNIGGLSEMRNIDVIKAILKILGKPDSLIRFVKDRPGHDWRYSMDISYIRKRIRWEPKVDLMQGLERTIHWYSENESWVRNVVSGEYRKYYDRMYGSRLENSR